MVQKILGCNFGPKLKQKKLTAVLSIYKDVHGLFDFNLAQFRGLGRNPSKNFVYFLGDLALKFILRSSDL